MRDLGAVCTQTEIIYFIQPFYLITIFFLFKTVHSSYKVQPVLLLVQ